MYIMHGYLTPTQRIVVKDNTGKKSTTKYTIKDSQEAFLYVCKSPQEIEPHLEHLRSRSSCIQPFLIAIGDSITDLKEFYIFFDGIKYAFKSFLRGFDVLFKLFHLFNLEYPLACTNFYNFFQEFLYKIRCEKKTRKIPLWVSLFYNKIITFIALFI